MGDLFFEVHEHNRRRTYKFVLKLTCLLDDLFTVPLMPTSCPYVQRTIMTKTRIKVHVFHKPLPCLISYGHNISYCLLLNELFLQLKFCDSKNSWPLQNITKLKRSGLSLTLARKCTKSIVDSTRTVLLPVHVCSSVPGYLVQGKEEQWPRRLASNIFEPYLRKVST